MATSATSTPGALAAHPRPRALADIHLNTRLAAQDQATSSEDEADPSLDVNEFVGVSIGKEQTRLTSPRTPAIEKAAAIESTGGFFPPIVPEAGEEHDEVEDETPAGVKHGSVGQRQDPFEQPASRRDAQLPLRRKVEDAYGERYNKIRAPPRNDTTAKHRASTSASTLETWQRNLMATLPSLPKNFSMPSPFSASHDSETATKKQKRGSLSQWMSPGGGGDTIDFATRARSRSESRKLSDQSSTSGEIEPAQATTRDPIARPQLHHTRSRVSELRRSASDSSLVAHTLSRSSSLGDDSRFENVQDQVNSRFKAIKDSLQDSSIRLPSLPSMPGLSNLKPDFLRERSGSASRKQNVPSDKPQDPMTRQPYTSAKAAARDVANDKAATHPHLHRAMDQLEGDLVILGGYRGSILRSAEPPHRQVWVPVKVGLNLRKVDLEVGLNEEDDEKATQQIIPGGMLTHIGPVDISRRLFKRLRGCENAKIGKLCVHDYGYDWRLDPAYLSDRLVQFLESLPCNQSAVPKDKRGAIVIAHSLGGLLTRHAVNRRPDLFRGVVYAGVPHTCVNILGPLRNGDDVLLSSRVLTAQVNFSIRTSFALLPLDGRCFIDKRTKEEYPVDFFDPKTWIEYRLSPCVARPLPPLTAQPRPTGISGYVSSMASALPSFPGRKNSLRSGSPRPPMSANNGAETDPLGPGMHHSDSVMANNNTEKSPAGSRGRDPDPDTSSSVSTTVTIPFPQAVAYLTRTLANVKKFKQGLTHIPAHTAANIYPPIAVIYGKSTPTVFGAKVDGREGIKHADAYDELAFASGDGVVLARAAMVPDGYSTVRGGVTSSERGHVTLLGDLEAVGKSLNAIIAGRRRGVGTGRATDGAKESG